MEQQFGQGDALARANPSMGGGGMLRIALKEFGKNCSNDLFLLQNDSVKNDTMRVESKYGFVYFTYT